MREITVATVQMKPELGRIENNLVKMSDMISTITSQQKVDLIVFPELITSGYELGVQFTEIAQRVPGPAVNLMAQRAADSGVYIAFGMASKEKVESVLYNTAILVGPEGEVTGTYHKVHLRGEERMAFREGFKMPVFDTGEIGRIGLMVGWDLAFPEVARALTLDGAELICCMANWEKANIDEWKTLVRARAFENAVFMAAANRVGDDVTISFGGESMIVGPRGKIHAALETDAESRREALKEQQELLRELQALRESKAMLEAEREAAALREKAQKEAATAKADGVTLPPATTPDPAKELAAPIVNALAATTGAVSGEVKVPEAPKADDKAEKKDGDKPAAEAKPAATNEASKSADKPADKPAEKAADAKHDKSGEKHGKKAEKEASHKVEAAEGYCVARIDLDEVRHHREDLQNIQARHPTVYKALVRRY